MAKSRKYPLLLRTLTPRKLWNLLRLYLSFHIARISKRPVHWGNPMKIGVEPTTSCNLRCPECPSGLRAFTRPTGMLTLSQFCQICDQVHRDLVYLLLYFQGEPYLNPDFLEMAAYSVSKGIFTATSTNAHYLNDENARKTVESGIQEVIISIDGTTQEVYEKYRIGGDLEKVLNGVSNLVRWKRELRSASPYIILQFLVVRPNEHQTEDIRRLGKSLGVDKVSLKTAQIYEFEDGNPLIPENPAFSRYKPGPAGKFRLKNPLHNQCWKLWQGAEITWDGRVLPCCFDKDAQHLMGKLSEQDFKTIWRSEPYRLFRKNLLHSRQKIDICKNCSEGTKVWA